MIDFNKIDAVDFASGFERFLEEEYNLKLDEYAVIGRRLIDFIESKQN